MPTIIKAEIKSKAKFNDFLGFCYIIFVENQLIPPKPSPIRGKPFQLSGNTEWLIYHHGKAVYLYNMKDKSVRTCFIDFNYLALFS